MSLQSSSLSTSLADSTTTVAALRAVWESVFADSQEFVDFYFKHRYPNAKTFISLEDGLVVAQAQCFLYEMTVAPTVLCSKAGSRSEANKATVGYVSGLATLPQFRRRGHAANIMQQLHNWLQTQGIDYCLLIPADQNAAQWYSSYFGYHAGVSPYQHIISSQELSRCTEHRELTNEIINLIQHDIASTNYAIMHTVQDIRDQFAVCRMGGGGLFSISAVDTNITELFFFAERTQIHGHTTAFRVLDTFSAAKKETLSPAWLSSKLIYAPYMYLSICNPNPLPDGVRITLMLD